MEASKSEELASVWGQLPGARPGAGAGAGAELGGEPAAGRGVTVLTMVAFVPSWFSQSCDRVHGAPEEFDSVHGAPVALVQVMP